ncbi:hypothetical protein B0T24DRAFT_130415 [Lasiosphaeria ovina]|uniref:Uncharacterized protein n=1 Tax=Lasiosphaeria ovina TaxID=92902 RepID=A0AAE0MXE3_9PEZI|nr:hypothetical protein B0T24DRAFT_130415 [Lasiosphaeria ovina]
MGLGVGDMGRTSCIGGVWQCLFGMMANPQNWCGLREAEFVVVDDVQATTDHILYIQSGPAWGWASSCRAVRYRPTDKRGGPADAAWSFPTVLSFRTAKIKCTYKYECTSKAVATDENQSVYVFLWLLHWAFTRDPLRWVTRWRAVPLWRLGPAIDLVLSLSRHNNRRGAAAAARRLQVGIRRATVGPTRLSCFLGIRFGRDKKEDAAQPRGHVQYRVAEK